MNVGEFLTEVRGILDDKIDAVNNPAQKFSNTLLLSYLQRHVQALCRIQAQRDQGYHNFPLIVKAIDSRNVIQNVFQWSLPQWVVNVAQCRLMVGVTDNTNQPTLSPYKWTTPIVISDPVQKKMKWADFGWKWEGNRTLQLWGYDSAPTLYLEVVKLPARLFQATIDQTGAATDRFYLPAALTLGTEDQEEGAYINAEVQVTSSSTISKVGQRRRVVYSNADVDSGGGVRKTELTLETPFSVALGVGDTVQSVIPYGEEHSRLLLLKAAWSCAEQIGNVALQKTLGPSMAEETKNFMDYVTPRDTAVAESWHRPFLTKRRNEGDRAVDRSYFT
jgi:hypothetical protein